MGGLVARAFALEFPEHLSGLVVLNSVFNRSAEQRASVIARTSQAAEHGPDANAGEALSRWFSREYQAASPAQIAAIRHNLASNDPQGYLTTYKLFATQDMYRAEDLGDIRAPTLIATGELDPGSTPQMARELAARIPGADVAILPDQRHMMPVESPRLVNRGAARFLRKDRPRQTGFRSPFDQGDCCMSLTRFQMCIDGQWVDALSGNTFEPRPGTGRTLGATAGC